MEKVYLTALTNERYLPGVMALARSLREVDAKYDLAIMIPAEKEESLGIAIREYGILDIPGAFLLPRPSVFGEGGRKDDLVVQSKFSHWRETFFKLQAAGCTEYKKVILLDSDMLVVKNLDHLFDAQSFTAAICGKCVHENWTSLNSGLLVLEPSTELHNRLLSLIVPTINLRAAKGLQAGDQDVFHSAFPDWHDWPNLRISEKYNVAWGWISNVCEKEKCKPRDFFIIHFIGKEKPWDFGKHYYIRVLVSLLLHGGINQLLYKALIWNKYRSLCERV